jgi:hypothetical protein
MHKKRCREPSKEDHGGDLDTDGKNNNRMDIRGRELEGEEWIELTQVRM